jgi:hypothetical protein
VPLYEHTAYGKLSKGTRANLSILIKLQNKGTFFSKGEIKNILKTLDSISQQLIRLLQQQLPDSVFLVGYFNFNFYSGGWNQGPLDTAATNGLLCQPRVIMMIEKSVELLAMETEVLRENLPQCRFVHHKPHMLPVREPGPPRWEASV